LSNPRPVEKLVDAVVRSWSAAWRIHKDAERLPLPHFGVAYSYVIHAFDRACTIAAMSRTDSPPAPREFVLRQAELDTLCDRAAPVIERIELFKHWPATPGTMFSWKAGDSALAVAMQFAVCVQTATLCARTQALGILGTATPDLTIADSNADPKIIAWRDAAMKELWEHALQPLPAWPIWEINRDKGALMSLIRAETERLEQSPPPIDLHPLIRDFLKAADSYLAFAHLERVTDSIIGEQSKQRIQCDATIERYTSLMQEGAEQRNQLLYQGPLLSKLLEEGKFDSTPVNRVMVFVDGGGGPTSLATEWLDLKSALLRMKHTTLQTPAPIEHESKVGVTDLVESSAAMTLFGISHSALMSRIDRSSKQFDDELVRLMGSAELPSNALRARLTRLTGLRPMDFDELSLPEVQAYVREELNMKRADATCTHPPVDGPFDPFCFRWKGKTQDSIEHKPFELLRYLWAHPISTIDAIEQSVWGDEAETDSRLKTAQSRAQRVLDAVGCPKKITKRKQQIFLED